MFKNYLKIAFRNILRNKVYSFINILGLAAYQVEISFWIFIFAGGITMFIALITISSQTIKAVLANPVESLRYE